MTLTLLKPRPISETTLPRRLGMPTATLVVVANMVGAGVFTTTGLLLLGVGSPLAILIAWGVGGLIALCGALSYGELAAAIPTNGGEYRLLSDLYHPSMGFVAGWLSLVVGFSAPIAASALAFGQYASAALPGLPALPAGIGLIVLASLLHASHVRTGAGLQNGFTVLKFALLLVFIVLGTIALPSASIKSVPGEDLIQVLFSSKFAVALVFVSFAYSGWNSAVYLAGEVRRPKTTLPRSLILGTSLVTLIYLGVNYVLVLSAPLWQLRGRVDIGHVAATALFGGAAGRLLSGFIAVALMSSVSAMVLVGPRVYEAMGQDTLRLAPLRRRLGSGGPTVAILLQATLAILLLVTSSFEALLTYIGVTLSASAALTVAGVFVLRRRLGRKPEGRPRIFPTLVAPLLFIGFSIWMIGHAIWEKPVQIAYSAATIAAGFILYAALNRGLPAQRAYNNSQGENLP